MHVGPGRQRVDQPGVAREVGNAAQLHLVVVGHQEGAALRRHEGAPELLALLGAHRDVVQVGAVRRNAAGPGHRLPEGRVDTPVRGDLGQQGLAVGRAELLHLAVGQQRINDRMIAPQALERLGIGREAGLGLLARGEAELVVEHGPQLGRRVDVELVAGVLLHLRLQRGGRLLQRVGDRLELGPVDADAGHFHFGQDAHERRLDVVVQLDHVLGVEAVAETQRHAGDVGRLAGGVLGQVPFGLTGFDDVEAELAGLLAQLRQLVLAGRGVEQVGRHARVHVEAGEVDAERKERPHRPP